MSIVATAPGKIVVDLLLNVAALVEVVHDRLGGISERVGTPTAAAALADLDDLLATRPAWRRRKHGDN